MASDGYRRGLEAVRQPRLYQYYANYTILNGETHRYFPHYYFFPNAYAATTYDDEICRCACNRPLPRNTYVVFLVNYDLLNSAQPESQQDLVFAMTRSNSLQVTGMGSYTHGDVLVFDGKINVKLENYYPAAMKLVDRTVYPCS